MAKQFTLGKNERLKSSKAIEQLFKEGKKITEPPFRVFYANQDVKCLLLGVGAGTKNFSHASDRNRIKRLIREAWRLQKNDLTEALHKQGTGLHVFIICNGKEVPQFPVVSEAVSKLITKLLKIIER
jgi:ribonuclease P protein component